MFVLFSEPFKFKEIVEMKFEIFDKINNYCLRILSVAFSIIIYFLYLYLQWTCKPTCGLTERFHPKRAKILAVFKFDFFFVNKKQVREFPSNRNVNTAQQLVMSALSKTMAQPQCYLHNLVSSNYPNNNIYRDVSVNTNLFEITKHNCLPLSVCIDTPSLFWCWCLLTTLYSIWQNTLFFLLHFVCNLRYCKEIL